VDDFKSRGVKDRAFKAGILVAADNERVKIVLLHPRADVSIAAIDFVLARQIDLSVLFRRLCLLALSLIRPQLHFSLPLSAALGAGETPALHVHSA
jgi:hypothetical protein